MPQAGLVTFGCKVNQYESAFMAESLGHHGWEVVLLSGQKAGVRCLPELIVVNTCTVTARADQQARQAIRRLARTWPGAALVVTGCYAQRAPTEVAALPGVHWVLGNMEKTRLAQILEQPAAECNPVIQVGPMASAATIEPMPIAHFWGHTRAFVKIQDGCQNQCSYCIIPQVRGPSRSLPPPLVIAQLRRLASHGFREVVLTGINLGRYGQDLSGQNLRELVRALARAELPLRCRLSSIEPQEISAALIQELAAWPQFCPHFHLPLQSGSAAILHAMRRPYGPAEFGALIEHIHRYFPQAALGLDVMVGFPGETAADFYQTSELLERLPITYLHIFPFSPRPGTPAAELSPTVPRAEVQRRAQHLRELGRRKRLAFYQSQVNQEVEVLIEGPSPKKSGWLMGLTENYVRVSLPGPAAWANRLIRGRIVELSGDQARFLPGSA